jgi:hypothetical protein
MAIVIWFIWFGPKESRAFTGRTACGRPAVTDGTVILRR